MQAAFHAGNRMRFYEKMEPGSMLILFSGVEIRKTGDEYYPFFAQRNFVYMTGIEQKQSVFLALKDGSGAVEERLYLLPRDPMAERWTGTRLTDQEAAEKSGINTIRTLGTLDGDLHRLAASGNYGSIWLDLFRYSPDDIDTPAHAMRERVLREYPFLRICNANTVIRGMRTIKQPCEIAALRQAEKITEAGILAMMKCSRPGMYEYQYKAEFDRALGQFGPQGPGFPSIISAGRNNFCIHYYAYSGQAQDGDMILNDVGAQFDNHITDVSRSYPCNGRFSERQRLLYACALQTSDYMFATVRPGMRMRDVDAVIRSYNAQLLKDAGVLNTVDEVGRLMWHGGAHHIGYDVHDEILTPEIVAPGMVFCIDVGIYHEAWGIGFRLEDNCLITETGCENLSAAIPRTVEEIESVMRK